MVASVTRKKAVSLAVSHLITTFATLAAILLFVGLSSRVLPPAFSNMPLSESSGSLTAAFLLNIAIILFGLGRSRDLREALDAHEQAERLAHRNANTDPLTGLANRQELTHSLCDLVEAKRAGILMVLDLDQFKRVNDLHGHAVGDQLLRRVADLLSEAAPEGACCARISADEFAVLIEGSNLAAAERLAATLISRIGLPQRLGAAQVRVKAAIGMVHIAEPESDETVYRRADIALYAAKRIGGFAWFARDDERALSERLTLEEDIRRGIENGEFLPYFQPLIDLCSGEMVGLEALARWKSPSRGLTEPEAFIETAERAGLVGPLTMSILEQALLAAKGWPARLKIAVNISPVQFRDPELATQILRVLAATGFPAHRLEIEITESSMLEDREQVTTIINSLKNVGVSVALDDFGTGYASLAQLHNFPVDRIKIDRSFITKLVKSDQAAAIVNTIASLGHELKVPLTAEGVESEQIKSALGKLGCSEAQGWLFGRAVSASTVAQLVSMSGDGLGRDSKTPPAEDKRGRWSASGF